MRIVQITDIHIGAAEECPYNIDCRVQFSQVLDEVLKSSPDVMVLSGDLCYRDPESEAYAWIAEQLSKVSCEVLILAGNHDSQKIMRRHFDVVYHEESDEIYFSKLWNGDKVIFLDTGRGIMSEQQYQWLDRSLVAATGQVILFMHHPPVYCGVPHMDSTYAFREIPRLQQLLQAYPVEFMIYCGHYHVEREIRFANQNIYITPSTFFQIDATQIEFQIDHSRAGYRVIEIEEGRIHSRCHYYL